MIAAIPSTHMTHVLTVNPGSVMAIEMSFSHAAVIGIDFSKLFRAHFSVVIAVCLSKCLSSLGL
jgi:hypothetical protein